MAHILRQENTSTTRQRVNEGLAAVEEVTLLTEFTCLRRVLVSLQNR